MENLEQTVGECMIRKAAISQRATEEERGLGKAGTMGFEKTGCYSCDGCNTSCKQYTYLKKK